MKRSVTIFPSVQNRILIQCVIGVPDFDDTKKDRISVVCSALIDTGAMRTCISSRVADYLSLLPTGTLRVEAANGHSDLVNTHIVNIGFGEDIRFNMIQVPRLNMEDEDMIIGMDILCKGNYAVSNSDNKTIFMYETGTNNL